MLWVVVGGVGRDVFLHNAMNGFLPSIPGSHGGFVYVLVCGDCWGPLNGVVVMCLQLGCCRESWCCYCLVIWGVSHTAGCMCGAGLTKQGDCGIMCAACYFVVTVVSHSWMTVGSVVSILGLIFVGLCCPGGT